MVRVMVKIELTTSQIENLMEFIEFEFIDSIRRNTECDNINYLVDMCDIYKKLKYSFEREGDTDG